MPLDLKPNTQLDPIKGMAKNPNLNMELGKNISDTSDRGDVYEAKHDNTAVIKAPKSMGADGADFGVGRDGLGNIGPQEIEVLHHLKDNPNVPNIINAKIHAHVADNPNGRKEGLLAMQKMPGQDVPDDVDTWKQENPRAVRNYWNGLADIHKAGVRHGDMHYGNIKHNWEDDSVNFLDFGESTINPEGALEEAVGHYKGLEEDMSTDVEQDIFDILSENYGDVAMSDSSDAMELLNMFYKGLGK